MPAAEPARTRATRPCCNPGSPSATPAPATTRPPPAPCSPPQTAHDRINPTEPAPRWLNFLTAAEISGLAAITQQAMEHLADAETATTQALTFLEPGLRRSHAYYSVQLTELQIAQGNTAGARTTVAAVDTTKVSSQNSTGRLATVRRTLATA
ncbi:hypothetical protein ACIODT_39300 [Streptomyces sp. NPDC088251]|uniref:hypothetical protein n=1 Tax=unclassified Streptomyces TaxID=2593676 RepID=UPI0037FC830D